MTPASLAEHWSTATLWQHSCLGSQAGSTLPHMCGPFVAAASLAGGRGAAIAEEQPAARSDRPCGRQVCRVFQVNTTSAARHVHGDGCGARRAWRGRRTRDARMPGRRRVHTLSQARIRPAAGGRRRGADPRTEYGTQLPDAEPTGFSPRGMVLRATGNLVREGLGRAAARTVDGTAACMPLLPVELAALASGSAGLGALTMLAFGIGTVPALAGFGIATGLVGARAEASSRTPRAPSCSVGRTSRAPAVQRSPPRRCRRDALAPRRSP